MRCNLCGNRRLRRFELWDGTVVCRRCIFDTVDAVRRFWPLLRDADLIDEP